LIKKVIIGLFVVAVIGANLYAPLRLSELTIEIGAEELFRVGPLVITNSILTTWVVMLGLTLLSWRVSRRLVECPSPRSTQNIVQTIYEGLLDYMVRFAGPEARRYYPIAASFFIVILTTNWFSLFPGFGSIGLWRGEETSRVFVPLFRGANADLNTTVALALLSVLSAQGFGISKQGLVPYLGRFVRLGSFIEFFKRLVKGKVQPSLLLNGVLEFFVGILEVFEELTKVISFSFRLFGNMFGGEVLLLVMAFILPYLISLPFIGLEIMSGFVQAFIFTILSTAFAVRAAAAHG